MFAIAVPPKFTVIPQDQEVNTDGRIELLCHAEGIPTPNIEWMKNGTRISCEYLQDLPTGADVFETP